MLEKVITYPAVTVETTGAVVTPKHEYRTSVAYILGVPPKVGKRKVLAWAEKKGLIPVIMPETVRYVVNPLDSEPQGDVPVFRWEE